jgi:hypothetical protein
MAQFDLNNYETVEQRHSRILGEFPTLRCVSVNHTTPEDRAKGMWVVESRVYLNAEDQAADLPKATDWAFEVDGQGMANKTSALENASTSALGRSLRWAFAGSKGPSREEMAKVARGTGPTKQDAAFRETPIVDSEVARIRSKIENAADDDTLNVLWASLLPAYQSVLKSAFSARKSALK